MIRRLLAIFLVIISSVAVGQFMPNADPTMFQTWGNAGGGTTFAAPLNVVGGHVVTIWYECFTGAACTSTGPTFTDTVGTTYTKDLTSTNSCGFLYHYTGTIAGSGANTVTMSTAGSFQNTSIEEWYNVTTTVDASAVSTWSSLTTIVTPSITTTTDRPLLQSAVHTCNSFQPYSVPPAIPAYSNGSPDSMASAWRVAGAPGSYSETYSRPTGGSSGNRATLALKSSSTVKVSTQAIPDGIADGTTPFSYQLKSKGGPGGNTWSITSGTLFPGLSLSSGGLISGTPPAGGTHSITFKVTDSGAGNDSVTLSFHLGATYQTPSLIQAASFGCPNVTKSVTAGDYILIVETGNNPSWPSTPTGSLGTVFTLLPVGYITINSNTESVQYAVGIAAATGSELYSCNTAVGGQVWGFLEYSNLQGIFDVDLLDLSAFTGGTSPITSGAVVTGQPMTLLSAMTPATYTATTAVSAPFTSDLLDTTTAVHARMGRQFGASTGSHTVSYTQSSNTSGEASTLLFTARPSVTGTAPTGGIRHRVVQ